MRARPGIAEIGSLVDERLAGAACAGMAPWFDADPLPGEGDRDQGDRLNMAAKVCALPGAAGVRHRGR
ncbi:hypothetical protein NOVA_03960 [Nocardia nova]|uniref:hypothetical protein n=1 Tax=Nocardia nova TaxID=37330 RepID=UPI001C448539|nr:hypothetical protein [Nocardia nova]MBV7701916.1 hypothetical protein [Nocardia nova]